MRKIVKRVRVQQDAPPNPDSRSALIIPENYRHYESDGVYEQFLLADSGEGNEERILVFGCEGFQGF